MFSLDAIIAGFIPLIMEFLLANKFSILFLLYIFEKVSKKTKNKIDDAIVKFFKNKFSWVIKAKK